MFAMLDPFEARQDPSLSAGAIAGKLMGKFSQIPDGFAGIFPPPPVPGLGSMGGFKLQIEDRAGLGFEHWHVYRARLWRKPLRRLNLSVCLRVSRQMLHRLKLILTV